ncbi:MAG: bile acid:sodium symporter family protein [Gammaproteobacteria bacterium]
MKLSKNPLDGIEHSIHENLIWIILFSYAIAAVLPGFGLWIRNVEFHAIVFQQKLNFPLPLLMLASLLFNAGLAVKGSELSALMLRPSVMIGGVFGNIATPLIFIVTLSFVLRFWHNPDEVQQILVGLALVAAMPIAGASTAWSQNANGNLVLSLGLVLFTTLLSPVITPIFFHTVGFVTTGDYSEDLHELASGGVVTFLGAWVILPSLLGILIHRMIGERPIVAARPKLKLVNYCVLILLNYSNASITLPKVIAQPDIDFLAIMLTIVTALCIFAFASGYCLARAFRIDRSGTVSLMFGLGMNNNGTGLVLASIALADHPEVMLPIIFYNLVQHLIASSVVYRMAQQPA